jgi:hypothetical protein
MSPPAPKVDATAFEMSFIEPIEMPASDAISILGCSVIDRDSQHFRSAIHQEHAQNRAVTSRFVDTVTTHGEVGLMG